MKIAGLVLAAGGSTRLGSPKQLLLFRGESFLRHAVKTALAAGLDPVIAVLGAAAERLMPELNGLAVTAIHNPRWTEGLGTSLQAGIGALPEDAGAVLILLCDQPLIEPGDLKKIMRAVAEDGRAEAVAASGYGEGLGVPAAFGRAHFPALAAVAGDQGARKILRQQAGNAIRIPLPVAAADIDTRAQYEGLDLASPVQPPSAPS